MMCATAAMTAADPMATDYTYELCQGSYMPYPIQNKPAEYPDSLTPVMINHVGRHGARYPSSAATTRRLQGALLRADSLGTITPTGKKLLQLTKEVEKAVDNRWGALDSLGEYEQRILATRMARTFAPIFAKAKVKAISSYSPRAMMSMYCFTHQLDRLNTKSEFHTTTGRSTSPLLRPFDSDTEYMEYRESEELESTYRKYFEENCPSGAISKVLGKDFTYADSDEQQALAMDEYSFLSGLSAMSFPCDMSEYLTKAEANALWACANVKRYLEWSSTTLSTVPAEMAAPLLRDIIDTTVDYIDGKTDTNVQLRFGHAETLMPLLALMHLRGCYYMTNYLDTVGKNWQDFDIVPMAANLQLILFRNETSGRYYLRVDLNGNTIPLLSNDDNVYTAWPTALNYLTRIADRY